MNTLWTATEKYVYLWKEICWKMLKLFEMTYRLWQKPAAGSFFSALPPFCHRRTARASEWTRYETREKTRVNPFWNFGIDFLCGTTWFRVCQRRLMQLARQLLGAALPHSYAVAMLSCVILFHIFGSIQFTSIHHRSWTPEMHNYPQVSVFLAFLGLSFLKLPALKPNIRHCRATASNNGSVPLTTSVATWATCCASKLVREFMTRFRSGRSW